MLDGLAWLSQGSGGSGEPRDGCPQGQTFQIAEACEIDPASLMIIFVDARLS